MLSRRIVVSLVVIVSSMLCATSTHAELKLSGFAQTRLSFWDSQLDRSDDFDVKRLRLKAEGPVNDNGTTVTVQLDLAELDDSGGGDVTLKDARIDQQFGKQWRARLGYAKIPFGYDVPLSSTRRLPFERAQVTRSFFPGERDTGLYFTYTPVQANRPKVSFGYSNGPRDWRDDDDESHAGVLAVEWTLPRSGSAGLSYMNATRIQRDPVTLQDVHYDSSVLGAHVRWNDERGVNLQAEMFDGKLLGADASGWYSTLECKPQSVPATFFYRYDAFDDGDPAHDLFRRHTLGAASDVLPNTRITVQWEGLHDSKGKALSNYGLQCQVIY